MIIKQRNVRSATVHVQAAMDPLPMIVHLATQDHLRKADASEVECSVDHVTGVIMEQVQAALPAILSVKTVMVDL